MNRFTRGSMLWGPGCLVLLTASVRGQAPTPPSSPSSSASLGSATGDLDALTRRMSEQVRRMADRIASDMEKAPSGPNLLQDSRELAQAIDEFRRVLPNTQTALRRRQLYAGIDTSWHHLLGRIDRAEGATEGVKTAARKAAEIDAQIHRGIGSNAYPAVYYGSQASPRGMPEIERLAHALVDRAEALLAYVRADMRGPDAVQLAQEVTSLVEAADIFHDGINLDARPDDLARNGFAGVAAASGVVADDLARLATARVRVADRIRAAWESYRTTEALLRQSLKLPAAGAENENAANPASLPFDVRTPVLGLSNRLVEQVDQFLIVFTPEAAAVPEGGYFIADARRLRAAAADFRDAIPRVIDVSQLAFAYRDVDALWQLLARRTNRIAQGRGGPTVQQIQGIGQTVTEIHRLLGMPGFPAEIGPIEVPD